jgi:acyl-coenzyme A thioesterase PaaI-like protein
MHIIDLPFNQLIGLSVSDNPEYFLMLTNDNKYTNHVQTVHAAALFALAEGTCGHFLLTKFDDIEGDVFPLLRKSEVKYKKPAIGKIYSKVQLVNDTIESFTANFIEKSRALMLLKVELFDKNGVLVFQGDFEWFVSKVTNSQ